MWKLIHGSDYLISSDGQIKNNKTQKILKPLLKSGYYQCCLYIHGQKEYKLVHRLVAEAFVKNPYNYPVVNHKDGNKLNNNYMNLEWVTYAQNSQHSWNTGLSSNKIISKPVIQYDLQGRKINEFISCAEASRVTGIKHIHDVAKGSRQSAGGYYWKFQNKNDVLLKMTGIKKPVIQYNVFDKRPIATFDSVSAAARATGVNRRCINDCCNKILKTAGNYYWEFI